MSDLAAIRAMLSDLATEWVSRPSGLEYDSGHCDSEIAACSLRSLLQDPNLDTPGALLDGVHRAFNLGHTDFGDAEARARLAERSSPWGASEIETAAARLGLAPDLERAAARAKERREAFDASLPSPQQPGAALVFDMRAYLQDKHHNLSSLVVSAMEETLDQFDAYPSFSTAARGIKRTITRLEDQGYKGQVAGMRSVLAHFGNPARPWFGIFPNPEALPTARRYRPG